MNSRSDSLLIGQLAFAEDDCRKVYGGHPAYGNGLGNLARNNLTRDMVFADDSAAQMAQRTMAVTSNGTGALQGTAIIGL